MLGSILKFWEPKEEFLLLEISPQKTKGLLLTLDSDKNISVSRSWDNFQIEKLSRIPSLLKRREIVVATDPSLSFVASLPLKIRRENKVEDYPTTLPELEDLLARSIDKSFNVLRKSASSKLGADETDTVLVRVKSRDFRVDGHKVHDALGFVGRSIEVVLDFTFTTRQIFEALKDVLGSDEGSFFTNGALAIFRTAHRLDPQSCVLFLRPGGSVLFYAKGNHTVSEKNLNWSFADFLEAVAARASIQEDAGSESFLGGSIVLDDELRLEPVMKSHLRKLASEVKRESGSKAIHIVSSEPLPFSLPRKAGDATFRPLPMDQALERFGFSLLPPHKREEKIFIQLAPFFESRFDRSDLEINRRLRRKINWLVR